jgi:hypothetical protein
MSYGRRHSDGGALGLAQRARFKPFFAPLRIQPSVCQLPLEMVSLMMFFFCLTCFCNTSVIQPYGKFDPILHKDVSLIASCLDLHPHSLEQTLQRYLGLSSQENREGFSKDQEV